MSETRWQHSKLVSKFATPGSSLVTALSISLAPTSLAGKLGTDSSEDEELSTDSASDTDITSCRGPWGDIGDKAVVSQDGNGGMQ